ncbi:MAG: FAD-dependent oxidoreductase [Deltaproteobacteria bacterium]|nr:FAD-dependent oxidoreductase [Deltaproteobacteria bacterium]
MNICIIGAGAAGRNASEYIRHLDKKARIDIFSTQDEIGYAPCEPPFVLKGIAQWQDIFYPGKFFEDRGINVHLNTKVTDVIRKEKRIIANDQSYSYDKLLLCPGAIPSIPPIPGLDGQNEFTMSTNIADGRALDKIIPKYSTAAVIGAGAIGIEITLALIARGYHEVYLLDIQENILPAGLDKDMASKVEQVMQDKGIELILSADIRGIETKSGMKQISLPNRELKVEIVFLTTGARPNVEMAKKAGIKIGETGGILVNEYLQTNDPDIYAAGDCLENWDMITRSKTRRLMVTTASRTGMVAGENLMKGNSTPYEGTLMSFVIEIFGNQIGAVGFTEKLAREKGMDIITSTLSSPTTRPHLGKNILHHKLIANRLTGTLIGAQIISGEIIRGIINELALAIAEKIPLNRLALIESPYSPAVGRDPIGDGFRKLMQKLKTS